MYVCCAISKIRAILNPLFILSECLSRNVNCGMMTSNTECERGTVSKNGFYPV